MKRLTLTLILGLTLAACGETSPPLVAQQTKATGGSAVSTVNSIRAAAGANAIRRSSVLDRVAKSHANDMARNNFFSHRGSNGSSVARRTKAAGYTWCTVSENLGKGYKTRSSAIASWRKSGGHYRNMVNPKSSEFGLANSGNYWVMVLAAKRC